MNKKKKISQYKERLVEIRKLLQRVSHPRVASSDYSSISALYDFLMAFGLAHLLEDTQLPTVEEMQQLLDDRLGKYAAEDEPAAPPPPEPPAPGEVVVTQPLPQADVIEAVEPKPAELPPEPSPKEVIEAAAEPAGTSTEEPAGALPSEAEAAASAEGATAPEAPASPEPPVLAEVVAPQPEATEVAEPKPAELPPPEPSLEEVIEALGAETESAKPAASAEGAAAPEDAGAESTSENVRRAFEESHREAREAESDSDLVLEDEKLRRLVEAEDDEGSDSEAEEAEEVFNLDELSEGDEGGSKRSALPHRRESTDDRSKPRGLSPRDRPRWDLADRRVIALFAVAAVALVMVTVFVMQNLKPAPEPSAAELKVDNAQLENELKLAERLQQEADQQRATAEKQSSDAEAERNKAFAREKAARDLLSQAQSDTLATQALVTEALKRETDAIAERARQERERRGIKSLSDAAGAELDILSKLHGVPKDQIKGTSPDTLLLIKQKRELEEQLKKLRAAASSALPAAASAAAATTPTAPSTGPALPSPPSLEAKISGPTSTKVGDEVTFEAKDLKGNISSFTWNLGDGMVVYDGGNTVQHQFDTDGVYTVTLTVEDNAGGTFDTTHEIEVEP